MTDNPFIQRYKATDTSDLLDILDSPSDYQALAVEAARLELESRQLTADQLADAKAEQEIRRQDKESEQQKRKDLEDKVKSVAASLAETINPIRKEEPTSDKIIKGISLFIGVYFLYQLYLEFETFQFLFTDYTGGWKFDMLLYYFPLILLPTASLLFWFRKKLGWTLATLYASYTAASAIPMFYTELIREPTGVPVLDALYPSTSPVIYLVTFFIFAGLTWTLCKEDIREVYQIDNKAMFTTLAIGIAFIFLVALYFRL